METIKSINEKLYNINNKLLLTVQEKFDSITPRPSDVNCFVLNIFEDGNLSPICDYIQIGDNNEYLLTTLLLKHGFTVEESVKLIQVLNMSEGA